MKWNKRYVWALLWFSTFWASPEIAKLLYEPNREVVHFETYDPPYYVRQQEYREDRARANLSISTKDLELQKIFNDTFDTIIKYDSIIVPQD